MSGRVVVLGDLATDVVAHLREPLAHGSDTTASVRSSGGGSAANVAWWLAWEGTPVTLVGRVGDDVAGRVLVEDLRAAGVDVAAEVDPEHPTGVVVVLVDRSGERTMLPDRGANLALSPADLPARVFAAGDHLHVSGYTLLDAGPRDAALQALDRARRAGMTTSVDASSVGPLAAAGPEAFLRWTAGVDLLRANLDEARLLSGTGEATAATRGLGARYGSAAVTVGAGGALWSDGAAVVRTPAVATTVVDTTGAGDAFTAGLLAAEVAGTGPGPALERGAALAARAVAVAGARPAAHHPGPAHRGGRTPPGGSAPRGGAR